MAFVYDLSRDADIEFLPLAELPPYAIVASDHPLAGERVVSLRRLAGEPMVLLDLPHSREYFSAIFHGLGLEPAIAYRTASPNMVRAMVANGLGYSLLNVRPRVDRALDGKPYVAVELKEKVRPLQMGIASVADVRFTRISTAFADFCRTTSRLRTFPCMPAPVPVSEGDTTRPTAPSAKPRPS
jgi:DNA-binding transcriptional LysR family regulator